MQTLNADQSNITKPKFFPQINFWVWARLSRKMKISTGRNHFQHPTKPGSSERQRKNVPLLEKKGTGEQQQEGAHCTNEHMRCWGGWCDGRARAQERRPRGAVVLLPTAAPEPMPGQQRCTHSLPRSRLPAIVWELKHAQERQGQHQQPSFSRVGFWAGGLLFSPRERSADKR